MLFPMINYCFLTQDEKISYNDDDWGAYEENTKNH